MTPPEANQVATAVATAAPRGGNPNDINRLRHIGQRIASSMMRLEPRPEDTSSTAMNPFRHMHVADPCDCAKVPRARGDPHPLSGYQRKRNEINGLDGHGANFASAFWGADLIFW